LLTPQALDATGLLNSKMVREMWANHLNRKCNHQRGLWTVLMLQSWLKSQ
jgi:hypothetical protein